MSAHDDIVEAFAAVPLFRRVHRGHLLHLAQRACRRTYKAGDVIVRQGDTSMSFYVVLSGSVEFRLEIGPERSTPVGQGGRHSFFGEMDLIDDQPRAATVVALEPTEVALLAKWDMEHELRHDPEVALALLPVLCQRIRELDAQLTRVMAAEGQGS